MSPKSFCRFFKANTGKTLEVYLHELRIGGACRFLIETNVPISEIALDCGYNNLSNFNRRFRSIKETPGGNIVCSSESTLNSRATHFRKS